MKMRGRFFARDPHYSYAQELRQFLIRMGTGAAWMSTGQQSNARQFRTRKQLRNSGTTQRLLAESLRSWHSWRTIASYRDTHRRRAGAVAPRARWNMVFILGFIQFSCVGFCRGGPAGDFIPPRPSGAKACASGEGINWGSYRGTCKRRLRDSDCHSIVAKPINAKTQQELKTTSPSGP